MGLRPGEIFGLQLGAISYKEDRVSLNIKESRSGARPVNELNGYVKTKTSYRILPVPPVLQDALVGYCTEFHDWDPLSGSKAHKPDALLIVGPYGVPESVGTSRKAIAEALKRLDMTKEHLGGHVTLQHLRRTCLSYIQNASELTSYMLEEFNPDQDGSDVLEDYGTTQLSFTRLGMRVTPKSASKYAGHTEQGESPDRKASPVTRVHYNRRVLTGDPVRDTSDWLSLMVKLEKRAELIEAGEEPDWSVPVAKKEQFLTDGDEGWVSYLRFADENGLEPHRIVDALVSRSVWLQRALGGPVPTRKVLPLDYQSNRGARPLVAMRLEHLEMVRSYQATVGPTDLSRRLGFAEEDVCRIGPVTNYMVSQGLVTPAEQPYSILEHRFHPEEVDRAHEALVVKPFLEQLLEGGAQPPRTLGLKLSDEPIFRTRTGKGKRRKNRLAEQAERCLEGLEADGLVEELRNGSWKITDQGQKHLEGDSNE